MRLLKYLLIPFFFISLTNISLFSQEDIISVFDWLEEDNLPEIILETDYKKLVEEKLKQTYQPGKVNLKKSDQKELNQNIQVRTRGRFRCITCKNPPLKLKFKKKAIKEVGFSKSNEWKVVMPCGEDVAFNQYLFKEYLVYKIYNQLSDYSLRVKLVKIRFQQTNKKRPGTSYFAFLIEDQEELCSRQNLNAVEDSLSTGPYELDKMAYTRFQLFQFMIGNTDWIPVTQHNLIALETKDKKVIPIPYDFDFAGLVNTHYAIPNPKTPLKNNQERFFMGNEKTKEELEILFEEFKNQKEAIYQLVMDFKWLAKDQRKKIIKYLDGFFEIIEDEAQVQQYFLRDEIFRKGQY